MNVLSSLDKSQALVASAPLADGAVTQREDDAIDPASLRDVARTIGETEIPLPPGLNSAAALDWKRQAETGPLTARDVRSLLQANAARDWVWYAVHATLTREQEAVLVQIPKWSALRGNALGDLYGEAIPRILAGDRAYGQEFAARQFRERGGEPARGSDW